MSVWLHARIHIGVLNLARVFHVDVVELPGPLLVRRILITVAVHELGHLAHAVIGNFRKGAHLVVADGCLGVDGSVGSRSLGVVLLDETGRGIGNLLAVVIKNGLIGLVVGKSVKDFLACLLQRVGGAA